MNPMGQQESPAHAVLHPLGSIRQILSPRGGDFAQKVTPDLNIRGRGTLGLHLIDPLDETYDVKVEEDSL